MSLFGQTKRHSISKPGRRSPLPIFSSSSDHEKRYGAGGALTSPGSPILTGSSSSWYSIIIVPLPRARSRHARYLKVYLPVPPRLLARIPRGKAIIRLFLILVVFGILGIILLGFRKRPDGRSSWSPPFTDPSTLVLTPEEVAMIWEWEVASGHYPSLAPAPENLPLLSSILNPAVPEALLPSLDSNSSPLDQFPQRTTTTPKTHFVGVGPERKFLSVWDGVDSHPGFPARPTPGSIMDLDLVDERCSFTTNSYVRDCLEYLRIGGGLDNGRRVRRGNYLGLYKQLYFEEATSSRQMDWSPRPPISRPQGLSRSPLSLPPPISVAPSFDSKDPCDPNHPRIFHMFWAGPFNDKPYMAVMSFLYTQNLGLDKPREEQDDIVKSSCRPQFWVWINPGPAAAVPNPSAKREMYESLAINPWSAPFLHERFRDVVKFRMWNTTEQLDGVAELKDHWRAMPIFNSGGNTYKQPAPAQTPLTTSEESKVEDATAIDSAVDGEISSSSSSVEAVESPPPRKKKDTLFEKVGSSSESDYDRLSVILSDMARFVLTHRFGGIYLDADTIFLRDWEELWNYRGQFAYRWSWHQKYNTAVLKLHKGSALSAFLFKTALENGLDFHPMTVSKYLKDAGLEKLLFRVPDALFDPAWLNMERYQRDRPPFPYFPEFSVFFSNDKQDTAGPQPLGFDGFFRGAFSYHFHNFWWLPFDPSRNWPDLGSRFIKGEKALRAQAKALLLEKARDDNNNDHNSNSNSNSHDDDGAEGVSTREDMDDEVDLSWSTVLKRTFEGYIRAERPNMYGEWIEW